MHRVKYSRVTKMTKPVQFFFGIAEYFFEGNIKNKLVLVKVLEVFCDSSTDKNITEQEIVHVIFTDPETHLPVLKFFI